MSTSRERMLEAIRRHSPEPAPLPTLEGEWIRYAHPRQQFADMLAAVGGQCVTVADFDALNLELTALPQRRDAQQIVSTVPAVNGPTLNLDDVEDPHDLAGVDLAILTGEFAVAENAAVWVTDRGLKHRVVAFLCQHLVLVVPGEAIVHNMHEAYERLGGSAFAQPSFGAFISGPSKTADIEQSLVIGAHGPRSQTVFLVGPSGTGDCPPAGD